MDPTEKLFKVHVFISVDNTHVFFTEHFIEALNYIKDVPDYLFHKQNVSDLYTFFVYTKKFYRQLSQAIR